MAVRRSNTDTPLDRLQYNTPRGSYPTPIVRDAIQKGPAPETRTRSTYPHRYNNSEGPGGASYQLFSDTETRKAEKLYEYPVKDPSERPFDYYKKPTPVGKKQTTIRKKGKPVDLSNPPNDPGYARVVTDKGKDLVGVMYHPEGNLRGFEKATLGALDKQGRERLREHAYRSTQISRASTTPYKT